MLVLTLLDQPTFQNRGPKSPPPPPPPPKVLNKTSIISHYITAKVHIGRLIAS